MQRPFLAMITPIDAGGGIGGPVDPGYGVPAPGRPPGHIDNTLPQPPLGIWGPPQMPPGVWPSPCHPPAGGQPGQPPRQPLAAKMARDVK